MEERELKKINDNLFELTVKDKENKSTVIKEYTKDELKENYEHVNMSFMQSVQALNASKKSIEIHKDLEEDEEIKAFMDLFDRAGKLHQKKQLEEQIEKQQEQVDSFRKQKIELELAVPELKRK